MRIGRTFIAMFALAAMAGFSAPAFAQAYDFLRVDWISSRAEGPRVSNEKSGNFPTKDGLTLHIDANLGDIRIFTDSDGQISYRAVAQADAREPNAESVLQGFSVTAKRDSSGVSLVGRAPDFDGRLWVVYELHVPRRYDLVVTTKAGDIQVQDIDGYVALRTAAGKIAVGNVNPPAGAGAARHEAARLDSDGGNLLVGDVSGDLHAVTIGGHITAGNVSGKALLRTGGGSIHAGNMEGAANIDTGGGVIRVESAHSTVTASTLGGQINFGEVTGTVHARTGGGAVRIDRTSGSATVDANGGNLFIHEVDGPLVASSASGSINAWLDGDTQSGAGGGASRATGPSQITAADGNVIVYLPLALAATVNASIEPGSDRHIVVDPSLPLHFDDQPVKSEPHERLYQGSLNGGGEALFLKAVSGNIFLRSADSRAAALVSPLGWPDFPGLPAEALPNAGASADARWNSGPDEPDDLDAQGFFDEIRRMLEMSWWGSLPMDSAEMQRRLVHSVAPEYPEVAQKAGVEGDVVLRVYISSEGRVVSLRTLEGPPILARAAEAAVQQWRFRPVEINGRPTDVVTTLTIAFRMR